MLNKLAIGVLATALSMPAIASDLPTLKLQIQPQVFVDENPYELVDDDCFEVCEFRPEISTRIKTSDRRLAIPGFVRPMNEDAFGWYTIPEATSFDWYSANVLGNVYPATHLGVMADVNWDGYVDNVFLIEVTTRRERFQLISVWVADPNTGSWVTHAEHLERLYQGIEVEDGEIFLTAERRGRWVSEPWHFPFD